MLMLPTPKWQQNSTHRKYPRSVSSGPEGLDACRASRPADTPIPGLPHAFQRCTPPHDPVHSGHRTVDRFRPSLPQRVTGSSCPLDGLGGNSLRIVYHTNPATITRAVDATCGARWCVVILDPSDIIGRRVICVDPTGEIHQ